MPSSFSDSMEHNGYLYMKGKQQTNQFMLFTLVSVRKIPSVSLAIGEIRGKQIRKVMGKGGLKETWPNLTLILLSSFSRMCVRILSWKILNQKYNVNGREIL